jgi:hypothetical protein
VFSGVHVILADLVLMYSKCFNEDEMNGANSVAAITIYVPFF